MMSNFHIFFEWNCWNTNTLANQSWQNLTCSLPKGFQKKALLCQVSTSFGINNFRNTWPMRLIFFLFFFFFSKHWIFKVDSKTAKKKAQQEIFGFLDNYIWIGNGKFSVTTRILVVGSQCAGPPWPHVFKKFPANIILAHHCTSYYPELLPPWYRWYNI